jgi:hypothetical protein
MTLRQEPKPSAKAFRENLKAGMPLGRKLWLICRNNLKKLFTASSCCGHPGEPGC